MKFNLRFFVILLICVLAGAEVDIFTPSFPELQEVFNLSPAQVELTLSLNFIAYCICSLFVGTLADKYDKSVVINISLLFFIIGTLACVYAQQYAWVLIGRVLQGIGISGPATLGYVIVMEDYPKEEQPAVMGVLNGLVTLSMAFAPVLGSYVSKYYHWQGNFILLCILAILCLLGSLLVIRNNNNIQHDNRALTLSPLAYLPLIKSKDFMRVSLGIGFLSATYWAFIGITPILYMRDLGVSLTHFGFYQGSLCGIFALGSILSSRILKKYGSKNCLSIGLALCATSGVLCLILGILHVSNPQLITAAMLIFAVAAVFPSNILYPKALNIVPHTQGRAAAFVNSLRLLLTATTLQGLGIIYNGTFFSVGIFLFITSILAVILLWHDNVIKVIGIPRI